MSKRRIILSRSKLKSQAHFYLHGFRLRVDVEETVGMPREVFVYCRKPPNPTTGEIYDEFMTVASFVDLSEFPAGEPNTAVSPFFRKDFVELDVRSVKDFENIWLLLVDQVCQLRVVLDRIDTMIKYETVVCEDTGTGTYDSETSESYPFSE